MTAIAANSVLPAVRRRVSLAAADGAELHGELSLPGWTDPVATLLCLHPLTTHGGSMESHVLRKMSWRLPALAGLAVMRFNMRGAGEDEMRSTGTFSECREEGLDLAAALNDLQDRGLPDIWLVGWSFGTDVVLKHGDRDPVTGAVLLSPPLSYATDADLGRWAASGRPLTALVPECDDYMQPAEAAARFAVVPQAEVIGVPGAGHLWVGERYVRIVLNEVVKVVAPGAFPLNEDWSGPMERWSDL